jgi:hypothetical protein
VIINVKLSTICHIKITISSFHFRGHAIRLFLFGDYNNLAEMYGISGANGMHIVFPILHALFLIQFHYLHDNFFTVHHFYLGRHPCLWCEVTQDEMKIPKDERVTTKRSLQQLQENLEAFQMKGSNLKYAKEKEIRNVIDDIYFNIPLDQVNL